MRTRDTPISGNLHVIYFKQQNDSERYIIKCYSFIDKPTLAMIISIDCVKTCFPNLFLTKIMGSFPFRHGIPVVTISFNTSRWFGGIGGSIVETPIVSSQRSRIIFWGHPAAEPSNGSSTNLQPLDARGRLRCGNVPVDELCWCVFLFFAGANLFKFHDQKKWKGKKTYLVVFTFARLYGYDEIV